MNNKHGIKQYNIDNLKNELLSKKDFEFCSLECFTRDIEHLKMPHKHNFYALILCTSGSGDHMIDFENYTIKPNRIFLINYGQVHSWNYVKNIKGFVLLFTTEFYNFVFTGNDKIKSDNIFINNHPYVDVEMDDASEWANIFKLIEQENLNKFNTYQEVICLLLKVLVLKFMRPPIQEEWTQHKSDRKSDLLQQYKLLINKHYREWKLPKIYAKQLLITPNYLNTICSNLSGKNATFYIQDRIILESKRLLKHSHITIQEIAYELGYNDKSHFGKFFKKSTGFSPEAFRNNHKLII